ncbi:hypothetical protein, partial [Clostridium botulinum]|uniref:hypothetical protein n=1 Tax=Clostridium botulinum TaxID=1491 RepID=UPI00057D6AAC
MFESVEEVIHMIEGSYKKFKSYYYYDKTLLYIKDKIAEFELDSELFNKSLKLISYNLFNRN